MFTGIIEETGVIRSVERRGASARITVQARRVLEGTNVGDSLAVNGVCLTVTAFGPSWFSADIMAPTIEATTLHSIEGGARVNLERALALGARLGGHIVSGHVDARCRVVAIREDGIARTVRLEAGADILRYMALKGSVALDGASLTVRDLHEDGFSVSIIPHTAMATTLAEKKPGDRVNVECDLMAKYAERLLGLAVAPGGTTRRPGMTEKFLSQHGFMEA